MQPGRRRQPGMGLLLLSHQLFAVIGIERIPPVTLAVIGMQVAAYLRLFALPWRGPAEACIGVEPVLVKRQYARLAYAAFEHADDWHLYYNMVSFAMKGISLERRLGSARYAYVLAVFTLLSGAALVGLTVLADDLIGGFREDCAIGFSAVIFALKVLTTYYDERYVSQVMGIPMMVSSRWVVWVELIMIQMLTPNVSFLGHLAGILVGMAYVMGPLRWAIDVTYNIVKSLASPSMPHAQQRFTPRAEASGYRTADHFDAYVPPGMSEEEQIRQAMAASMQDDPDFGGTSAYPPPPGFVMSPPGDTFSYSHPPPPGFAPDIEQLRSRRTAYE